jgi:hypothetical protein
MMSRLVRKRSPERRLWIIPNLSLTMGTCWVLPAISGLARPGSYTTAKAVRLAHG